MKSYTVYMHVAPNGKKYIGITSRLPEMRWGSNGVKYKNNEYFMRAIGCFGWDNIKHIILADGLDKETAEKMEMEIIRDNKTADREYGYNIKLGGNSSGPLPQSTKNKLSAIMTGRPKSDQTRDKLRKALTGHVVSAETRKKISMKLSGSNNTNYGKPRSDETKRKIAEAQSGEKSHRYGKKLSEEHKASLSARHKGIPLSQEHIHKLRESIAAKVNSVEQIDKNGVTIALFPSAAEASRVSGVERRNICSVCAGDRKHAGGFRWRYA